MKSQIRIYYIFSFFNRFMIYMPVFVLFLNEKGLDQSQIMILISAYNIAILVGEIPTGILADKISRKTSVMIGSILQAISMMLIIYFNNIYCLIIVEVIFGLGVTFQSGAGTAMLYDFLKSINEEDSFPKVAGRSWASTFIAQGIGSIIGGVIAKYNMSYTIILTAISYFISAAVIATFKEVNVSVNSEKSLYSHTKETVVNIITNKKLLFMIILQAVTLTLFTITMWLYQPYLQAIGIPVIIFGIYYFMLNIASALGGIISYKFKMENVKMTYSVFILAIFIPMSLMGIIGKQISLIFPILIFFFMGVVSPWLDKHWNKEVLSHQRATAGSINNSITTILFPLISPFIGGLSDKYNVFFAFNISSLLYLFSLLIIFIFVCAMNLFKYKNASLLNKLFKRDKKFINKKDEII